MSGDATRGLSGRRPYEPALSPPVDLAVISAFTIDVGVAMANLRRTARLWVSLGRRRPGGTGLSFHSDKTESRRLKAQVGQAWLEECHDPAFFFRRARTCEEAWCLGVQLKTDLTTGDLPAVAARVPKRVQLIGAPPSSTCLPNIHPFWVVFTGSTVGLFRTDSGRGLGYSPSVVFRQEPFLHVRRHRQL